MSEFEKLLADLDEIALAKSAASENADLLKAEKPDFPEKDDEEEDEDADENQDEGEDEEQGDLFSKAMEVTLPSGERVEAYDGTLLVKALGNQVAESREAMQSSLDKVQQALVKTTKLLKSLVGDNEALRSQVEILAASGRGRRSSLSIHDKPAASIQAPAVQSRKEILAKALVAQQAGKISGYDVATAEETLNKGLELPARFLSLIG